MKRISVFAKEAGLSIAVAVLAAISTSGCLSAKTQMGTTAKPEIYRKVYYVMFDEDPRKVHPRVLAHLKEAGFQVITVDPDGPPVESQGSGFVITPQGHLLTCAHVLEGQTNATAWIDGSRYEYRVMAADTNIDAALLEPLISTNTFQPLPFSTNLNYRMGQDAYTIGFPLVELLGSAPRLNKGLVSATVGIDDSTNQVQVSAAVQPGNSGGPLLDEHGHVIGLVSATLNALNVMARSGGGLPQNVNFATKAKPVRDFVIASKVTLPPEETTERANPFEEAKRSLALLRGGIVTEADLKQPSMICRVQYLSLWDMYYRFRVFQIEFYDMKKGELILKSGQYGDDLSSEDAVIDKVFKDIYPKFFPGEQNPFGQTQSSTKKPATGKK